MATVFAPVSMGPVCPTVKAPVLSISNGGNGGSAESSKDEKKSEKKKEKKSKKKSKEHCSKDGIPNNCKRKGADSTQYGSVTTRRGWPDAIPSSRGVTPPAPPSPEHAGST